MRLRNYEERDRPHLEALFRKQGFAYELPDLAAADMIVRAVIVDEDDVPRQAILARRTVELYMLQDDDWSSPMFRFEGLRRLHIYVREVLARLGVADANVWLPPSREKSFGSRLQRSFGWRQNLWSCFTRKTKEQ